MGKRELARAEAKFLRGETGVDGQAVEEEKDPAVTEQEKAREQVLRGGTFLGREFLTWLLWRSEAGEPLLNVEKEPVGVLFAGRLVLRGVGNEVTEVVAKGGMAPYALLIKETLQKGLLVHAARLQITHGEKAYEATLDAEFLDVKSAKLPELMTEEEDDQLAERLYLSEQLSSLIDALAASFMSVRASAGWKREVVPALKSWMSGEREAKPAKAARAR